MNYNQASSFCHERSALARDTGFSVVGLADSVRLLLMVTPKGRGVFREQVAEVLSLMRSALQTQAQPLVPTVQTVFLRESRTRDECQRLFSKHFGSRLPLTTFVRQPPCCGAGLAVELWASGGQSVQVMRTGPHTFSVDQDGIRWIHCGGIELETASRGPYGQTLAGLEQMRLALAQAGVGFENVVRTWFYLSRITQHQGQTERYHEFNRARTDFYSNIQFYNSWRKAQACPAAYPASTGIGMSGAGLAMGCLALHRDHSEASLLPLENPQQTPAYQYPPRYSPKSPKFSRALALLLPAYTMTWISGTASVVDSESRHAEDLESQVRQTIDNIERLIAPENFSQHGASQRGARMEDLAMLRVYLKRPSDLTPCQEICERRFGPVPAIYAVADICRPELLVEIEGVAFSKSSTVRSAT